MEQADAEEQSREEQTWRRRYEQLQAEVDALRKRWEQRFETESAAARHAILRDMLPLADHLELALQHGAQLTGDQAQKYVENIGAMLSGVSECAERLRRHADGGAGPAF